MSYEEITASDELWVTGGCDVDGVAVWERRWLTEPPAEGAGYRIIRESWVDEAGRRIQVIHEWEPLHG